MDEIKRFEDLLNHNELLQDTINQIRKDLNLDEKALFWNYESQAAYNDFVKLLEKVIQTKLRNGQPSIMQLLYRVDITEKQSAILWHLDEGDRVKKLTSLILNRELQKVLTRKFYSKNEQNPD
ncbi:MAG: hypothetical protein H6607_09030 [Flavobacteriales bacterium]|nr:hypothetical protein [Flavobacteriales bacterium]